MTSRWVKMLGGVACLSLLGLWGCSSQPRSILVVAPSYDFEDQGGRSLDEMYQWIEPTETASARADVNAYRSAYPEDLIDTLLRVD